MKTTLPLALALAFLAGCTTSSFNRTTPGLQTTASIAEAMDGGLVGRELGQGLGDRDRRMALEAEYAALERTPGGEAVKWQGESGRWSGEVVAAQPYRVGSQDCRQYTHRITGAGGAREARGTACRNPDGSWTPLT
ncbi:hypothetical protein FQ775_12500 [Nitratireductor mangrovi]|uniref:Surface antigen domain-containing protein n=1 Tax=Nitratireductor mangrovi TaxID=2599600 RepID=A0A5B8KZV2_9HYPH|nr:hypothetical protein [Nitratireductor mangrovi]QDZ01131.1 hypothetical protein FQ775_12500 [Nitratireductor mangrovi]